MRAPARLNRFRKFRNNVEFSFSIYDVHGMFSQQTAQREQTGETALVTLAKRGLKEGVGAGLPNRRRALERLSRLLLRKSASGRGG
jgi:hypothetical protein